MLLVYQIQATSHTVCTGTQNEMITPGGEYGFILAMISDSFKLRDQVWLSLLGGDVCPAR